MNALEVHAQELVDDLDEFIAASVARNGGSTAPVRPGHRVKFHWPPHPVSYEFHLTPADWKSEASFEAHGETFSVAVAQTPHGVFGRCEAIWHEDRGETLQEMLENLRRSSEPLFQRQLSINEAMGRTGRFKGHIRDLPPEDILKLLYCPDRDVANAARIEIETHASMRIFTPALIHVLRDERHPHRRTAQWCVLDLFEDLPSFCESDIQETEAVDAIKQHIWNAPDDYARTAFKAGVVLGGHLSHKYGAPVLTACLSAPSKIGRRSAIHGLFHVAEWVPTVAEDIVNSLQRVSRTDPEPLLREYAGLMARDIANGVNDHVAEPFFDDEA